MNGTRYKLILDDNALRDLETIRDYIEARGAPDTAGEFIDKLLNDIEGLTIFPLGHAARPNSRKLPFPLWQMPTRGYRVIYTILEESRAVRVLGVQHGSRSRRP